ncbi:Bcl-2-like protein 1 [Plakobranchus ocellatus]|uniref:Bcl-2-like protein 1 n=1 Tax=Plakobranchus ocellatus TaxID=259542 RepID=A0AAV4D422_9GAST|nr:Bcl-2-like protein 1 [Plakobranchus ocellatus]
MLEPRKLVGNPNNSLFRQVTQRFGVLDQPGHGLNDIAKVTNDESTQTYATSQLDSVRRTAEVMAQDVVVNFDLDSPKKPPNRHCKTMRRTVKELSDRHDMVFKGMVNRLKPTESNSFQTFVIVADEIFDDGQVNWGRIVAVYAFAARLAKFHRDNSTSSDSINQTVGGKISYQEKIALFVGKYVATKLGQWVLDHGGWDAFVEYFPDQGEFEEKMWKGVLFTAIGLGALATVVASR